MSYTSRVSTLCLWYLRSLPFRTRKDHLLRSSTRLLIPAGISDDTLYHAFMYLDRYQKSVKNPIARLADRMDELPLLLSFYLALELAILEAAQTSPLSEMEMRAAITPSPVPDFGKYGFVEQERCLEHGPNLETPISARDKGAPDVEKAHPGSTGLHCGPEVCSLGMWILLLHFKNRVLQERSTPVLSELEQFPDFRIKLLRQEYIAKVCAMYLKSLNFGIIPDSLDRVPVMHNEKIWPCSSFIGTSRYRASPTVTHGRTSSWSWRSTPRSQSRTP